VISLDPQEASVFGLHKLWRQVRRVPTVLRRFFRLLQATAAENSPGTLLFF
jgi:hypothetical protein